VARVDLDVPDSGKDALRVSSLVLVSEARPLPSEAHDSPFAFGDKILVPAPNDVVSRSTTAAATYFLSIVPAKAGEPHASLDLFHNGAVMGSTALALAQRDASGRIQQAGKLPIGQLAPGPYVARVTVRQGTSTVTRERPFVVVD
jgi:hypothetical protein